MTTMTKTGTETGSRRVKTRLEGMFFLNVFFFFFTNYLQLDLQVRYTDTATTTLRIQLPPEHDDKNRYGKANGDDEVGQGHENGEEDGEEQGHG
jgi:hypothetical protein